jgi:integrase
VRFTDKGPDRPGVRCDSVGLQFKKLAAKVGVKVPGGFYLLRHVHRTVADEAKDSAASAYIMGHHDPSMAGYYREVISNERLVAVVNHVRDWLMAGKPKA